MKSPNQQRPELRKPVERLAYRDGYKTGPGTPNGQDAFDGKLLVW